MNGTREVKDVEERRTSRRSWPIYAVFLLLALGSEVQGRAEETPPHGQPQNVSNQLAAQEAAPDEQTQASLEAEEEGAEATLFDVYLGDNLRGLVLANFTDEWVEIKNVDDILEQLSPLQHEEKIRPLLEGKIRGRKELEEVGSIVCNSNTFTIRLDLKPEYLTGRSLALTNRLPDPQNDFSMQQLFSVATSGDFRSERSSALTHRTLGSVGRFFTRIDGTVLGNQDKPGGSQHDDQELPQNPLDDPTIYDNDQRERDNYELNEASLNAILGSYELGFGALRSDGRYFVGSADYLGAFLSTSEDVFVDRETLRGSRMLIFVPSHARVEFFRGNRLLSVQILDFGLQEVDTRSFPQGSYEVDIIIRQDTGQVTRERRFFTKSGLLAIRSRPIYSLRAGILRDNLDAIDSPLYQAGARVRALSFMEVGGAVDGTEDLTIGTVSTQALLWDYIFGGSLSYSSEGTTGVSADASGKLLTCDWYVNFSHTPGDKDRPSGVLPPPKPLDLALNTINALGQQRTTLSGSFGRSVGPIRLQFRGNRNKRENEDSYAYGPELQWNIWQGTKRSLNITAAALKSNEGKEFYALVSFSQALGGSTPGTLSMNAYTRTRDGSGEDRLRTGYRYLNKTPSQKGVALAFNNEIRQQRGDYSDTQVANEITGEYSNNYIRGSGFLRDQRFSESDKTTYGVVGESSFLIDRTIIPQIAYPFRSDAAIVAAVKSGTTRQNVEVLVNGSRYESVKPGSKAIIGLEPFRTYKVAIRPIEADEFVMYDIEPRTITLFPGNIVREEWSIDKMFIGLGRVVDVTGKPIEWERINGPKEYTATEDDGYFQAELTGKEKLTIKSKENNCVIDIPQVENVSYSHDYGTLTCK